MSRNATPANAQSLPQQPNTSAPAKVPHEKIAMRAYEKWVKRGKPAGSADADWLAAEAELKTETTRPQGAPTPSQPQPQARR